MSSLAKRDRQTLTFRAAFTGRLQITLESPAVSANLLQGLPRGLPTLTPYIGTNPSKRPTIRLGDRVEIQIYESCVLSVNLKSKRRERVFQL
jgi:hypothetical protein